MVRICAREVKADTGKLHSHSPYIGMNVCGSTMRIGAWSMACVVWEQIEYYH